MRFVIIGALTGMALAYFGIAFVMWNLSPGEWGEDARGACAGVAVISAVFGGMVGATYSAERRDFQ